jgi:hypothetical protein
MAGSYADLFSLIDRVKREYPSAAYLLNHPEVGPLLLKAVAGEYDQQTFQQKLYATKYWKSTADAQRKWDAFASLDPASAKAQVTQMRARLKDLSGSLGRSLTAQGQHWVSVQALRNGWDDTQVTDAVLSTIKWGDYGQGSGAASGKQTKAIGGDMGATIQQLRALNAQYMVQGSDRGDFDRALRVLGGEQTMEGIESMLAEQAKQRWTHLSDSIEAGVTPAQYFEQHRAVIAEQLEINPDQVDLMRDPAWRQVISHNDEQSGQIRPMTLSEATTLARKDERWKATKGAQAEASSFAENLARMFGEVAA